MTKGRQVLMALLVSVVVTFSSLFGAYLTSSAHEGVARLLFWPGYWLQSLVPSANLGTPEHPLYEANMGHVIMFFAGVPVALALYFIVAFVVLRLVSERGWPNQAFNATARKRAAR